MKLINVKNFSFSMESNFPSLDQSMIQSSKEDLKTLESLGSGPVIVGLGFRALVAKVGMFRAIKSLFVRYRYTLNLWIVREIYLWRALNQRFSDIPPSTKEHRFLSFVNKYSFCKTLALKLEKKCLKRLISSPSKPSLTVNNLKAANDLQRFAESRRSLKHITNPLTKQHYVS